MRAREAAAKLEEVNAMLAKPSLSPVAQLRLEVASRDEAATMMRILIDLKFLIRRCDEALAQARADRGNYRLRSRGVGGRRTMAEIGKGRASRRKSALIAWTITHMPPGLSNADQAILGARVTADLDPLEQSEVELFTNNETAMLKALKEKISLKTLQEVWAKAGHDE
jgi:hypothetical protein